MSVPDIPFIDLGAQRRYLGDRIDNALLAAVNEGRYILGPQVAEFEAKLAAFSGAKHVIGCANGTDAIALSLMALGVKAGDGVICPSFTFAATAEVVAWLGAVPIFADIDEQTFNIAPSQLAIAMDTANRMDIEIKAVIAVDLFGQPADYHAIESFCGDNNVKLIADSAQSFGSEYHGRKSGTIGDLATTSFFPAKPLGCYGDGGAVFTDDDGFADHVKSLRFHGKGSDKYDNVRIGMNSRLDTLQAAILLEKLAIYDEELEKRQIVADRYAAGLGDIASVPVVAEGCTSVWAQYVLRLDSAKRDGFIAHLKANGVPTAVYYPRPLHRQTAYKRYPVSGNGLPVSEKVAMEVVALPMHPYLEEDAQNHIIDTARAALS